MRQIILECRNKKEGATYILRAEDVRSWNEWDRFYIVMNGECGAFVTDQNGYRQVGTIPMYGFFGESSLLSKPGVDDLRNATVEVMSDSVAVAVSVHVAAVSATVVDAAAAAAVVTIAVAVD